MNIKILHFDDERYTVSCIADAMYTWYALSRPDRVAENEVEYNEYMRAFVIVGDGGVRHRVEYVITDDIEECRGTIDDLAENDIAIFDLMRDAESDIKCVGAELYKQATLRRLRVERLFLLTGFPNLIEELAPELNRIVPQVQRLLKPVSATEMAERLIALFPIEMRPAPDVIS